MPEYVAPLGTLATSAASVLNPTNLAPGLPGTQSAGDWLFMHTASTSTTATVATPSGWQSLVNAVGLYGRNALFALRSIGAGDPAPTVTWTGLTTGASGTPCMAHIVNLDTGFGEIDDSLVMEVAGVNADQAASPTVMAGGSVITAETGGSIVFAVGVRRDEAATGIADDGTDVAWIGVFGDQTTSGTDMLTAMSYAIRNPGGAVGDHTWLLTGGVSAASSGVMVAVKPTIEPVPTRQLTKSTVAMRRSDYAF